MFDAVNGIERRFTPIYVQPKGPRSASVRAAATMAAYTILVKLYPGQKANFDSGWWIRSPPSVTVRQRRGTMQSRREWLGDKRPRIKSGIGAATTGSAPLFPRTPAAPIPASGGLLHRLSRRERERISWACPAVGTSSHRPNFALWAPPMGSVQYANDFNETKIVGSASSSVRSTTKRCLASFGKQVRRRTIGIRLH